MKKSIVVVEDDLAIQDVIQLILEQAGYQVLMNRDCKHLLDVGWVHPDIYLLSIVSKKCEGVSLCQRLKAFIDTKDIPILFMSTLANIEVLAQAAGANASMEKPFAVKTLQTLVEYWANQSPSLADA